MASRLCPYCMQISDSELCPHCGNDINYEGQLLHLPAGYVVSGKHPYVLGAALGWGGFGITYIALDMVTNERMAIKEYFPTYCASRTDRMVSAYPKQEAVYEKGRDQFLDEARTLKSLSDLPSIVNVLDFFELNNTAYLVMEFLEGSSLKDYLRKNGIFPAQKFLEQITPLLEDVQKMHDREILHLDFEPDHIFIQPDGRMKIIDFGAARHYVQDRHTTMFFILKKFHSPEIFRFHVPTAATDVYSLAGTIYYCITGTAPPDFAERSFYNTPLPVPSASGADTTAEQDQAFLNALELEQTKRTQSIRQFLEELHRKQTNSPRSLMSRMLGKLQKKQNITRS